MVKMLENKAVKVIEDPESEPKIDDKPESGPEVVDELAPLQEEGSSRYTEVEELPNEILIDLPPEPYMKLVPSSADMGALFFFEMT